MTCDRYRELLPWLLNGTLDPGERHEVEQHLKSCEACRRALAETRQAWQIFDHHVPSEQLVAYAWGDESGVDRELVAQHLATCPQCAAELELAAISRRLEGAEDAKVPLLVPLAARRPPAPARLWRSSALAASLVALVAATGWFESAHRFPGPAETLAQQGRPAPALRGAPAGSAEILRQAREARQKAAELARKNDELTSQLDDVRAKEKKLDEQVSQIQQARKEPAIEANGALVSPQSLRGVERGGPPAGVGEAVPAGAPFTVVTLPPSRDESYDQYALDILDAAGKRRQTVELALRDGQFNFVLRRGALAAGTYTLQLYGIRAGKRVALDTYALRIG